MRGHAGRALAQRRAAVCRAWNASSRPASCCSPSLSRIGSARAMRTGRRRPAPLAPIPRRWLPRRRPLPTAPRDRVTRWQSCGCMIRLCATFRLVPIVLVATGALFALKTLGLVLDGGYTLWRRIGRRRSEPTRRDRRPPIATGSEPTRASAAAESWAQEMFGYPDITGSVGEPSAGCQAPEPAPSRPSRRSRRRERRPERCRSTPASRYRRPSGRSRAAAGAAAPSSRRARASSTCAKT